MRIIKLHIIIAIMMLIAVGSVSAWHIQGGSVGYDLTGGQTNVTDLNATGTITTENLTVSGTLNITSSAFIGNKLSFNGAGTGETSIDFSSDNIIVTAGGVRMVDFREATPDSIVWNEDGVDLDVRIESDTLANGLFFQGSSGNLGLGVEPIAKADFASGNGASGTGGDNIAIGYYSGGGYRHWIKTRHTTGTSASNKIEFWINNGTASGDSSEPGVGNVQVMDLSGDKSVDFYGNIEATSGVTLGSVAQSGAGMHGDSSGNTYVGATGGIIRLRPENPGSNTNMVEIRDGGIRLPEIDGVMDALIEGAIWYDTTANQFKGYNGTGTVVLA